MSYLFMRHNKSANYQVGLPVVFYDEGDAVVAYSPAIDLATQGDSLADAKRMFAEASELFIDELLERGTLESALKELGWHKVNHRWQIPKKVIHQEIQKIKVPA